MRQRPFVLALAGSVLAASGITALVASASATPTVATAAATALPELVGAHAGAPTTAVSGGNPYQTTSVTFTFDQAVTTAAPVASNFHLVGFDSNWRVDGTSATQPDGTSVVVTFGTPSAPVGAQQIADASIASVGLGAVTGAVGTNPVGSVPLGNTQTLTPTEGRTAAPDLVSVSGFTLAPASGSNSSATNTAVTFTFDQPAYVTNQSAGYLVMNDGNSTSKCTYDSGSNTSGTTGLAMLCSDPSANNVPATPPIVSTNVFRAYIDPGLVSADPQNPLAGQFGPQGTLNPLESVRVSGVPGSAPTPHLASVVYRPGTTVTDSSGFNVGADQVEYHFDQTVAVGFNNSAPANPPGSLESTPACGSGPTPTPTGACFLVVKADGTELWAANPDNTAPAISGNGPRLIPDSNGAQTVVLVTFPAGTLQGAVGAAVTTGAVIETTTVAPPNQGDWVAKAGSGSVSRVPGTTNGPILIGVQVSSIPSPARATYVFSEDLAAGTLGSDKAKMFYLADSDGTKLQCQNATIASGQPAGSNNKVTCLSFQTQTATPGTATDTQITQATEGYVEHNAVTSNLPPASTISASTRATQNPETAFVITSAPIITKISPTSGSSDGGTVVTITGTNFTNASAVAFGTTPAKSYTVNSATSITATSPQHDIGPVDITVTTPQGASQANVADIFTYVLPSETPPQVTGISPSHGPAAGGTQVQITGSGFTPATEVDFGSTPAPFEVLSDTSISASAPAHSAGPVHVTVISPNGASPTSSADVFTYSRITITASLSCTSPRTHVVRCKVSERRPFSGLKVVFKKRTADGWTQWDVQRTNARGNATMVKKHLHSGKRLRIKAIVHGNSRVAPTQAGPDRVRVT